MNECVRDPHGIIESYQDPSSSSSPIFRYLFAGTQNHADTADLFDPASASLIEQQEEYLFARVGI